MGKYSNKRKQKFLDSRPTDDIENSDLASRSSFCFSFLDINQVGQDFDDWNSSAGATSLARVLDKIKDFTRKPLKHWIDAHNPPLVIYGGFPENSEFTHPKHVPHDVAWGRFRLGNKIRLVGFVVPEELHETIIWFENNDYRLSKNIFYVVFLDKNHKFYKVEPA